MALDAPLRHGARHGETPTHHGGPESFLRAHLIVGPVHENLLGPVARYGEARAVPVVSPLAHLTHTNSGAVFQLAPRPARKYDKAAALFTGDARRSR